MKDALLFQRRNLDVWGKLGGKQISMWHKKIHHYFYLRRCKIVEKMPTAGLGIL